MREEGAFSVERTKPVIREFRVPDIGMFAGCEGQDTARYHEGQIADMAGLRPAEVLFIPVVEVQRFIPDNIPVYDGTYFEGHVHKLNPDYHNSLREAVRSYAAVRVCVPAEHRDRISKGSLAIGIFEYLTKSCAG